MMNVSAVNKDKYYVYKHIEQNKIVYIGCGKNERLFSCRRYSKNHSNFIKNNILNNNFNFAEIIKLFDNKKDALKYEMILIKKYQPIYNFVGKIDFNKKISIRQKGKNNSFYNKTHSEKVRKNISNKQKIANNFVINQNGLKGENNPMWGKNGFYIYKNQKFNFTKLINFLKCSGSKFNKLKEQGVITRCQ